MGKNFTIQLDVCCCYCWSMIRAFFFLSFFLWYPNFGPKTSKFSKIYTRETEISQKNSIFGLKKQQILSEIKSLIMNLSICLFLAKFWHLGTNKRDLPNLWKNPPYFKGKKFEIARFSSTLYVTSTLKGFQKIYYLSG